jgi:hypothetical protein
MAEPTYTVVYRSGGPADCTWRRTFPPHPTRDAALKQTHELEQAGYHSIIDLTSILDRMGLPVGWESAAVDWENDTITQTAEMTRHTKRIGGNAT